MKCTESWLREWVNPKVSLEKLCDQLTMAGFEVEEVVDVAKADYAKLLAKKHLKDAAIEFSITPNRGDCLSVRGMAREVAALTKAKLTPIKIKPLKPTIKDKLNAKIKAKNACPRYLGRIIRNVDVSKPTPEWMRDRLITAGVFPVSVIVDITNYVMIELGQPMHAFDLHKIDKEIIVRMSSKGESITLLNDQTVKLDNETLVIADANKPIAIAGIMGGMNTCISNETKDVFLEVAFFPADVIARQRQAHQLLSDGAHRWERGVDSTIQLEAMHRVSQLIIEYASGNPGPIIEVVSKPHLPKIKTITLNFSNVARLLGAYISPKEIEAIFKLLMFSFKRTKDAWRVTVPSYRNDLTIEEDLIEEIARMYGFDKIKAAPLYSHLKSNQQQLGAIDTYGLREQLVDLGYHEMVSYSFIDQARQKLFDPNITPLELQNPITAEMSVMRTSLWPGLVNAMLYNLSRQQSRIRLFELGVCFVPQGKKTLQENRIAGLITGLAADEQWGLPARVADFFDMKGDVCNLLQSTLEGESWEFKPGEHPALHPGQTAVLMKNGQQVGVMGALHPSVLQALGLADASVFVFEIAEKALNSAAKVTIAEISKFPGIRRDIAILIKQAVPATKIQDTIRDVAGTWLKDVFIFDVYEGKGIAEGYRSVALALHLQHPTRTLVDEEVATLMNRVITVLKEQLGAELRS